MKKIAIFCVCIFYFIHAVAQDTKDITYDYFKMNSQAHSKNVTITSGEIMRVYTDMIKDWKYNDMNYVMKQINAGLDLFKDSLSDESKTHVLEIAITPNQNNTFFRYKSYQNTNTDVTMVNGELIYVKHQLDTIRVFEHFQKISYEDTFINKLVYEILIKDISNSRNKELTTSFQNTVENSFQNKKAVFNIAKTISRFGVYWGVGLTVSNHFPIGLNNDMGFLFATGRSYNNYTPFIGYNLRYSLTYADNMYRGAEFHLFEWGTMKSTKTPYHLAYNKYSLGIGIMRTANSLDWDNGFKGNKYMLGLTINFPIISNLGVSIETGNNLSKTNPKTYVGISMKAYLSGLGN